MDNKKLKQKIDVSISTSLRELVSIGLLATLLNRNNWFIISLLSFSQTSYNKTVGN